MSQNPGLGTSNSSGVVSTKTPLTPISPTTSPVTSSSTEILAANPLRLGCIIVNLSNNPVSLAFGADPAVSGNGITLTTLGSVYQMSEYDYTLDSINAISTAGSNVSIQEFE